MLICTVPLPPDLVPKRLARLPVRNVSPSTQDMTRRLNNWPAGIFTLFRCLGRTWNANNKSHLCKPAAAHPNESKLSGHILRAEPDFKTLCEPIFYCGLLSGVYVGPYCKLALALLFALRIVIHSLICWCLCKFSLHTITL